MRNILAPGQRLNVNEELISPNTEYTLRMQIDGNLVLYHGPIDPPHAYWHTNTWQLPANERPSHVDMQADGNLVLYDSNMRPHWASGSWGPGMVHPYLELQDDGNLVVYARGDEAEWASGRPGGVGQLPGRGYVPARVENVDFDTGKVDMGANHWMQTRGALHLNTGWVTGSTHTETDTWFGGFHGGVRMVGTDEDGLPVAGAISEHYRYGVDGTGVPWGAPSKRDDAFQWRMDPSNTDELLKFWTAQTWDNDQFSTIFDKWLAAGKSIDDLIAEVAPIAKLIATMFS